MPPVAAPFAGRGSVFFNAAEFLQCCRLFPIGGKGVGIFKFVDKNTGGKPAVCVDAEPVPSRTAAPFNPAVWVPLGISTPHNCPQRGETGVNGQCNLGIF